MSTCVPRWEGTFWPADFTAPHRDGWSATPSETRSGRSYMRKFVAQARSFASPLPNWVSRCEKRPQPRGPSPPSQSIPSTRARIRSGPPSTMKVTWWVDPGLSRPRSVAQPSGTCLRSSSSIRKAPPSTVVIFQPRPSPSRHSAKVFPADHCSSRNRISTVKPPCNRSDGAGADTSLPSFKSSSDKSRTNPSTGTSLSSSCLRIPSSNFQRLRRSWRSVCPWW